LLKLRNKIVRVKTIRKEQKKAQPDLTN